MQTNVQLKISQLKPLISFIVPLAVISIAQGVPGNCVAGINDTSLAFGATIFGAALALWFGRNPKARDAAHHV